MSWKVEELGEVCQIINGRNQKYVISENGSYPIFGSGGNVMGYATKFLCEENTVIIGRKGNISNPILIKQKFWNVDTAFGIYPFIEKMLPLFNYYQCLNIDFASYNKGTTIPSLVKSDLLKIQISYPKSLSEQQAIVEKLDAAFALIDQAKANIEKNIQNAKELFQSKLNQIFSQKGEGWEEKKLGEVCKIIGGGTPSKNNKSFYDGEIPWITVRDMKADLISETEFSITELAVKKSATNIIHKGNVIIATRVSLGKICIVDRDSAINQDLKGIIPKINIEKRILFWWFKSIAKFIENSGVGLTVKGVKLEFVNNLIIIFPKSLQTQQEIVSQLDALSEQTKQLETKYQAKLANLEELRKSILEKAFKGELVQMSESQISTD